MRNAGDYGESDYTNDHDNCKAFLRRQDGQLRNKKRANAVPLVLINQH